MGSATLRGVAGTAGAGGVGSGIDGVGAGGGDMGVGVGTGTLRGGAGGMQHCVAGRGVAAASEVGSKMLVRSWVRSLRVAT